MKMVAEFNDYFVAEISFRKGNPPHRVIAVCTDIPDTKKPADFYTVFSSGYEDDRAIKIRVSHLLTKGGSFKLIKYLKEMRYP